MRSTLNCRLVSFVCQPLSTLACSGDKEAHQALSLSAPTPLNDPSLQLRQEAMPFAPFGLSGLRGNESAGAKRDPPRCCWPSSGSSQMELRCRRIRGFAVGTGVPGRGRPFGTSSAAGQRLEEALLG
mmetsp:Transcript_103663/g.232756  ORF Transcript_103663/g.232756 Transcript_103663/m.232756 type:complete len:127 (-) Transcript_103663:2-382(-)